MTSGTLVVVLVVLAALSRRSVFAAVYVVDGSEGGGEPRCKNVWLFGCNYDSWAANINFLVGDTLVFNFDPELNSLAQVSELVYSTCENGISVLPSYITDKSPFPFTIMSAGNTGNGFFVSIPLSSNPYRCFQKLHITVPTSSTTPSTPTTPPPDAPSSSTTDSKPTPPPPSTTPTTPSTPPASKSKTAIVEAVVGAMLGAILLGAKIWMITYCMERRRKKKGKVNVTTEDPVFSHEMDEFGHTKVVV